LVVFNRNVLSAVRRIHCAVPRVVYVADP